MKKSGSAICFRVILSLSCIFIFSNCGMNPPEGKICYTNDKNEIITFNFKKNGVVLLTDEAKEKTYKGSYSLNKDEELLEVSVEEHPESPFWFELNPFEKTWELANSPTRFSCSGTSSTSPASTPCSANFTVEHEKASVSTNINFKSNIENAKIKSWDFGDGIVVPNESNPTHAYFNSGKYTVKMLYDCNGEEKQFVRDIEIYATKTNLIIKELSITSYPQRTGRINIDKHPDLYCQIIHDGINIFDTSNDVRSDVEFSSLPITFSPDIKIDGNNKNYTIRIWDDNVKNIKEDVKMAEFNIDFSQYNDFSNRMSFEDMGLEISIKVSLVEEEE